MRPWPPSSSPPCAAPARQPPESALCHRAVEQRNAMSCCLVAPAVISDARGTRPCAKDQNSRMPGQLCPHGFAAGELWGPAPGGTGLVRAQAGGRALAATNFELLVRAVRAVCCMFAVQPSVGYLVGGHCVRWLWRLWCLLLTEASRCCRTAPSDDAPAPRPPLLRCMAPRSCGRWGDVVSCEPAWLPT